MFGSQVLDVAIALVLMLFLLSLLASAIVEAFSACLKKRARDLERVLGLMIDDAERSAGFAALRDTGSLRAPMLASGRRPSYVSAKAFADAVVELVRDARRGVESAEELFSKLPPGLRRKLEPVVAQVDGDLTAVRAELEAWFDETMDRLSGAYKRWSHWALAVAGAVLTLGLNASAVGLVSDLWNDPVTRAVVTASAADVASTRDDAPAPDSFDEIAAEIDGLDEIGLPLGWSGRAPVGEGPLGVLGHVVGWVATTLLILLGAPFWFDVLSRLMPVRGTGPKPARADNDAASATTAVDRRELAWTATPDREVDPRRIFFDALG